MDIVSIVDEFSDSLSYRTPTFRVSCVGTNRRVVVISNVLDPIEGVLAEYTHVSEGLVDHASEDFTIECDGALADFLRIADVQSSRLSEFILCATVFLNNLFDLLAADGDLSTHGILGLNDIFAETVENGLVIAVRQRAIKERLTCFLNGFTEHDRN